jgi:hypothetical protein
MAGTQRRTFGHTNKLHSSTFTPITSSIGGLLIGAGASYLAQSTIGRLFGWVNLLNEMKNLILFISLCSYFSNHRSLFFLSF